jgi:hypothetical protein
MASLRKPTGSQASRLSRTDGLTLTPLRPRSRPRGAFGYGFRHPGANGMQVQDSKTIGKRKAPVPRGGGGGTLEDRRSIPDGCGQHVPGLNIERHCSCELRLREPFSVTRESGLDLDCRVSSLDIFNDDPMMSRTKEQSIKEAINVSAPERWPFPHAPAWRRCRLD